MKRIALLCGWFMMAVAGWAQINTDRVMAIGRNALYFEDYVLSIQYFNQVIGAKPYLYEPYFFRALAKFYLEDFSGAEMDCTEAIARNPYVVGSYEVRGLSRINRGQYSLAADDYHKAISYSPEQPGLYQNLVLCEISDSNLVAAGADADRMLEKWPRMAKGYTLKADICLKQKDTLQAEALLDKALELDPYEGQAWSGRAILSMARQKYAEAEEQFGKAIHLLPKSAGNYINRALCRYHQNKLGAAMKDYDVALDIEPESYIGHYNRALLRAQLGDDNRAIEDFNFVLERDPEDMLALYNRATLLEQTGDLHGAIRDYTTVIGHYPDFWTGLLARAACRRKIGDIRGAEKDEFTVTKAQIDKRFGGRTAKVVKTRKRSDKDLDNYRSMVVADETEMERKYNSDYRGRVQDRKIEIEPEPMFVLSYYERPSEVKRGIHYYKGVDDVSRSGIFVQKLLITNAEMPLDEKLAERQFQSLNRFSELLGREQQDTLRMAQLHLARSLDYYLVQDLDNALRDLNAAVGEDPELFLAYFTRAVVRYKQLEVQKAQEGSSMETLLSAALGKSVPADQQAAGHVRAMDYNAVRFDLDKTIALAPDFVFAYFNRANLAMKNNDFRSAIVDYDKAVSMKGDFAEAYYNRGLCYLSLGQKAKGVADLSKAGELGLYQAYNLIKRYSEVKE